MKFRDRRKPDTKGQIETLFGSVENKSQVMTAVVDPILCEDFHQWYLDFSLEIAVLYPGVPPKELLWKLPILVQIGKEDSLSQKLLDGFGQRWCIFIQGQQNTDYISLASHLSKFLFVRMPTNKEGWFRFYDPCIFSDFFRSAGTVQKNLFFSDQITRVCCENIYTLTFDEYSHANDNAKTKCKLYISFNQKEVFNEKYYERFIFYISLQCIDKFNINLKNNDEEMLLYESICKYANEAENAGAYSKSDIERYISICFSHMDVLTSSKAQSILKESSSFANRITKIEAILSNNKGAPKK